MAKHPVSHIEIPTANTGASSQFYNEVFGWQIATNPTYNYTTFEAEGGLRGGFAAPTEPSYKPDRLMVYLATDDIDATLATIEAHGGKTEHAKTEIPGVGTWAIFSDPAGNHIGLFTANRRA
jgi:predicted enzyme related to lactoylglutathione lyase